MELSYFWHNDVCEMWQEHFSRLYNVLDCDKSKQEFFSKVSDGGSCQGSSIAARDVAMAIKSQKKDKSAGPNGLFMESFIHAGIKLYVHLSLLFTFCLRHCYLRCLHGLGHTTSCKK